MRFCLRPSTPLVWVLLFACLLLAVGRLGADETVERIDLERAVALALERNAGLQTAVERRNEVVAGMRDAKSQAWPQFNLVSGWTRSQNPSLLNSPDFSEFLENFPGGEFSPREQELWNISLEVRQLIYNFGKLQSGLELARVVVEFTEAQIDAARLETARQAAIAYYRALQAAESATVIEIQERTRLEALELVEARYDLREATELERLRAEASLAEVRPTVARLRGNIDVSESALRYVLGLEAATPLELVDLRDPTPRDLPELEELLEIALSNRPEVRDLNRQSYALDLQKEVVAADARPEINLYGRYGRQARLIDDLEDPLFADWLVNLGLSWSLFDGGARKAQIGALDSQSRQIDWQLRDLRSRIALDLETAIAEYQTAVFTWRASETAASAAAEAARVAEQSYRQGVALQTDWLDAQELETTSRVRAVESSFEVLVRESDLLVALGLYPTASWDDLGSSPFLSPETPE